MRTQILLTFGAILCHVAAVPLKESEIALRPRDNTTVGISETLLSNFKLYANFTSASYCQNNENSTFGTLIACPATVCPLVEADNVTSILSFGSPGDTSATDIKGYVALDPVRSQIVLAFAGSGATIRNWLTDFTFVETASTLCDGCFVHSGFALGWDERRVDILASINSTFSSGDYSLVVTGHSVGAAVATLAATELRNLGYELNLYTFGSPRVGNDAFAEYASAQGSGNYRMTHLNDPVPQLPPTWIGYEHTSPEYWLSDGNATTEDYGVRDVVVCEGLGNDGCNAGTGLVPIDGEAHNHYLGLISACQGPIEW